MQKGILRMFPVVCELREEPIYMLKLPIVDLF